MTSPAVTSRRLPRAQAFALVAGPVAWTIHLVAESVLVPVACDLGSATILHLLTLGTAAVTVLALFVARRNLSAGGGGARDRIWFTAAGSLLLNGISLALILQEGAASFFLSPCL